MKHLIRSLRPAAMLFAAVGLIGCGQTPRESAVVNGTVLYRGKPLPDAEVHLLPKTDTNLAAQNATTDSAGHFVIKADGRNDRPVDPGTYIAVINKYVSKSNDPMAATDIVPARYSNRTKSPLVVEIKAGNNELPPFELKAN